MTSSFGHLSPPISAGGAECHSGSSGRIEWDQHLVLRRRALVAGLIAGLGLLVVYIAVLGAANSLQHVVSELARLWLWVVPLVLGFAVQIALFVYARGATKGRGGLPAGGVVGSGVANTVSMLACCAHHLADVLPFVGLAGAALMLARYQSVFLVLGVASNLAGLTYFMGLIKRHRLFPERSSTLSLVLRLPVERALPVVLVFCAGSLATSIFFATH
jgi:hypothetical protein